MKKQNFDNIFVDAFKCNHCGICLQNCPAYRERKQEKFSPRGRVQIACFLTKQKLNLKQDKQDIFDVVKTCKNCYNCTVLCPTGINPQNINERLKNIFEITHKIPQKSSFKKLIFRIYFRKFFKKTDNLFITSSQNFKQIKQNLALLKENNFESSLHKESLTLTPSFLEKLPDFKTYIFDDIGNYRLIKNAVLDGKINLNTKQILFITQVLKPKSVELADDSLIILSNKFLTQETKAEEKKLFEAFKDQTLNFASNRYYFGPDFNKKTLEYLKNVPEKTFITLSKCENIFLKKLVKKYKINKEILNINDITLL